MRLPSIVTPAFLALAALLLGAGTAHGQVTNIRIDGDILDWPHGVDVDEPYDVAPRQVEGIDVTSYETTQGIVRPETWAAIDSIMNLPAEVLFPSVQFIFRFRFGYSIDFAPIFPDSVESGIELLFDIKLDRDAGQLLDRWTATPYQDFGRFRPDTRVGIWGQAGRITRLTRDTWDGTRWVPQEAAPTMAGVVVAQSGPDLEGAIEFGVLGVEHDAGKAFFGWAAITTQGDNHDYVPDGETSHQYWTTPVREKTWGEVKGDVP